MQGVALKYIKTLELENETLKKSNSNLAKTITETKYKDEEVLKDLQEARDEIKKLKEQIHKDSQEKAKLKLEIIQLNTSLKDYEDYTQEDIIKLYIEDNLESSTELTLWGKIRDDYKNWIRDKKYKDKPTLLQLKSYLMNKQIEDKSWSNKNGSGNNVKFNFYII